MKIRAVHNMMLIGLLAIGLVCGFLYFGPNKAYANLLTNGDMETNNAGDPASWTKYTTGNGRGARNIATYRNGVASAKEDWSAAVGADTGCYYYQSFSASAGQVYVASAYLMSLAADPLAAGAEAFVKIEFKNTGGTIIRSYESPHLSAGNSNWERHTVVGIAPEGTATVQMNIITWTAVASASGSAYFDDADLHQTSTSTCPTMFINSNVLDNASFEVSDGGGTPRPLRWSGWTGGAGGGTCVLYSADTANVNTGTYSVQIGAGATSGDVAGLYLNFPAQYGQVITATCYAKTVSLNANTDAYLKLTWYDKDGTQLGDWVSEADPGNAKFSDRKNGNTAWTQLTVTGVPPSVASGNIAFFGRIECIVNNIRGAGTAATYAYFDDIEVKGTGGFGQKMVATTPNVLTTSGLELVFDEGWGGNISDYADYSIVTGTYRLGSDANEMHALFDINYMNANSQWGSPSKNPYGSLTVIEQSPARMVMQAYATGKQTDKTSTDGTDIWTITYTIYPDGRIFLTESGSVGSVAFGNGGNNSSPFWAVNEEYTAATPTFLASSTACDDFREAGILPDGNSHDAAMVFYEISSPDVGSYAGGPIKGTTDSNQDRSYIELASAYTRFTASSAHTHHWMLDFSEGTYTQALLDSKRFDYQTKHTSGSDITFALGSLVTGINSDANSDGYDEGAGCWNILASSNALRFTLNAGTQSVTRRKPAFFITGWTNPQLPAEVEVNQPADAEATTKELGTDYNAAFVPFSSVYKRYATHQTLSSTYAQGYNDKASTPTVTTPYNPVDADTSAGYASWFVDSTTSNMLDLWGFDLGSARDFDAATAYVAYKSDTTGTADTATYGFKVVETGQVIASATATTADTTGSAAITSLTDALLRKLEVRAYTDSVGSAAITVLGAGAGTVMSTSGSMNIPFPAPAGGWAAGDLILLQVVVKATAVTYADPPTGFTTLYTNDTFAGARQRLYYKFSSGAEATTCAVTIPTRATGRFARMYAFRGVHSASTATVTAWHEGAVIGTGNGGPINDAGVTSTDRNRLALQVIGLAGSKTFASFTPASTYTWMDTIGVYTTATGGGGALGSQYAQMTTLGTIDGGSSLLAAPSVGWAIRGLALKPANTNKTCYVKSAYIGGTYYANDITDSVSAFNTSTTVFADQNDYLYVGSLYKFAGILVDINTAAGANIFTTPGSPDIQYYNGSWTTLTLATNSLVDNTSGFTKDGMITFTTPGDWTMYNQDGSGRYIGGDFYSTSLYYVRIKRTAADPLTDPTIRGLATNNIILEYMTDVTTNTTFALVSATLVDLIDFNALGYFGKVKLSWKTESEYNNIGFNILRSEDAKNYAKINNEIIPGLGTSVIGREYAYEDTGVTDGKTYYYLLEDVESGGKTTRHGPVAAHPGADFDKDEMTDDWEYYYGLPATVADANVDSDDDGLTNLQEFLAGTNPAVIDSENIPGVSGTGGVKVVESSGSRTVLELDTSVFNAVNRVGGGATYQLITLPEYVYGQTADVGKPQIPAKGILLGTSSKKPVAINILEYEKDTLAGYNVYPVPKAALTEDPNDPAIKRLTYEFYKDANAYAVDAFYPGKLADVDYSNYLQDQQVIKVNFYPIQFNPVKGTIEFYKKIKLEVLQEGADLGAAVAAVTPKTAVPLTAGTAYKIYVNENGIYRLTRPYLESQGISLSDVDPRNLKIYNQGAEIPVYVSGSDYIEFYGQAVDTKYTGTNVYWLVLSDEPGLRMSASGQAEDATATPGSFLETYKGEDNTLYWMEATGEDHWFIDAIYGSQVYNLTLNLNGVANSADEATVKISLEGSTYSGEAFTHHVYARLNGYPIADATWQGAGDYTINSRISQSYLNEGANTVTLEVGADPNGYEEILVNWVEISYRRNFAAKDNALAFGNYTGGAYKYQVSGFTDQDVEAYDITDPKNVQRITQLTVLPEDGGFAASFKDTGSKDYMVLTQDKAKVPAGIVRDEPSNLADKKNKADYIIITHEDFYDTVLPFADYRSKQGLKVKVVKLGDIYDEFNYGIADVNAVKDFLKYAYNNWTGPRPAYVLLVGDATCDYRDYSGYGFTNYVPTYMVHSLNFGETGSDNWFVCFDGENDLIPDMLIGRFPVKTTDELKVAIDKIIRYEAISPDEAWTKKVLLVADNDEKIFADTSEKLASYLTKGYTVDKQYLGETTNSPAALKQGVINSINEGRLFVNYTGHGGVGLWANERIFTWDDINSLYNRNTLPVLTTLTCADGYFVYPRYIESLGERLVNDANGGAIAAFVPSGISFPTTQAYLAEGFYGAYFKDRDAILGSMVAKGKLNVYENEPGGDAANVIQTFVLFGDPALRVKMKAPQIPAVAAPAVFDLNKGKVNEIFRLTEEPKAAQAAGSGTVIIDKGPKKGLTRIVGAEEAAPVAPQSEKGSLGSKAPQEKGPGIKGVQLEDKTLVLAPPKWRVLSKSEYGALKAAKPYVNIDYSAIEKGVTDINKDASQLAELKTKFDKAVKDNDLQKASSILSDITKLARKIYWRTF